MDSCSKVEQDVVTVRLILLTHLHSRSTFGRALFQSFSLIPPYVKMLDRTWIRLVFMPHLKSRFRKDRILDESELVVMASFYWALELDLL